MPDAGQEFFMANNISVKDASSVTQVMKTTDTGGVHTTHHNIDLIAAGSNVIGRVGVNQVTIEASFTTSATQYTANDWVGTVATLANVTRANGGTAKWNSLLIRDYDNEKAALVVLLLNATLAVTDNAAASIADGTGVTVIRAIQVPSSAYVSAGGWGWADIDLGGMTVKTGASTTSLYALLICTGTPTFTADDNLRLEFCFEQD